MKFTGKILMFIATTIILVHTSISHQHKTYLGEIVHKCLFAANDNDRPKTLLEALKNIVKHHSDQGENHLENFRTSSSYEHKITVIFFIVPEYLSLLKYQLDNTKKTKHLFYYNKVYISNRNILHFTLRGPPIV